MKTFEKYIAWITDDDDDNHNDYGWKLVALYQHNKSIDQLHTHGNQQKPHNIKARATFQMIVARDELGQPLFYTIQITQLFHQSKAMSIIIFIQDSWKKGSCLFDQFSHCFHDFDVGLL